MTYEIDMAMIEEVCGGPIKPTTTLMWVYGFASKLTTSIPGATVADAIEWDGSDILANTKNQAWRGIDADGKEGLTIQWRRAGEGETSRDGLWVVGGGQWRFGC